MATPHIETGSPAVPFSGKQYHVAPAEAAETAVDQYVRHRLALENLSQSLLGTLLYENDYLGQDDQMSGLFRLQTGQADKFDSLLDAFSNFRNDQGVLPEISEELYLVRAAENTYALVGRDVHAMMHVGYADSGVLAPGYRDIPAANSGLLTEELAKFTNGLVNTEPELFLEILDA